MLQYACEILSIENLKSVQMSIKLNYIDNAAPFLNYAHEHKVEILGNINSNVGCIMLLRHHVITIVYTH